MNNPWDTIREAIEQSRSLDRAVQHSAYALGSVLKGKLRYSSHSDLVAMKKELADYNMHTREWKTK